MTFHPEGLFTLIGFAAVVVLGVNARAGLIDPMWALAGGAAYVIVEATIFFGPVFTARTRTK